MRNTIAYRRWKKFFELAGVEYEEGDYLPGDADFVVKCFGYRGNCGYVGENLYIYVMDEEHSLYIGSGDDDLLIVFDIFDEIKDPDDVYNSNIFCGTFRTLSDDYVTAFNYETIDGDWFNAYPAFSDDGRFYLFGDCMDYIDDYDVPTIYETYKRVAETVR